MNEKTYLIGQAARSHGMIQQFTEWNEPVPWTMRPSTFKRRQPAGRPLIVEHIDDWVVGEVQHYQRGRNIGMLVGASADDNLEYLLPGEPGDKWFLSCGTRSKPIGVLERGGAKIEHVSLTRDPGNLGLQPVRFCRGEGRPRGLNLFWDPAWKRFMEKISMAPYNVSDEIEIYDEDPISDEDIVYSDPDAARRRLEEAERRLAQMDLDMTRLHIRSFPTTLLATQRTGGRELTGRLVPFNKATKVVDKLPNGEHDIYLEGFRPGAFSDQIGTEKGVSRVALIHRHEGGIGYLGPIVALRERSDGLYGHFSVLPSKADDVEALLARGINELSVEFVADQDATEIDSDGVRWRTRARLHGVALVEAGAYSEAKVLRFRSDA